MSETTIQDWTRSTVLLKYDDHREVKYRVYRNGEGVFQEVRKLNDAPIRTLEIPEGMKLRKHSYEVMLRYVLLDVNAA